jgi:repressor of nif and glnA expression
MGNEEPQKEEAKEKEAHAREILKKIRLDHYCTEILKILWHVDGMCFNEIHRQLKNRGIKLSKPSLSEHLTHLRKRKFITRKAMGVQNVTYSRIRGSPKPIQEELERRANENIQKFISMGVVFSELTPESKADKLLCNVLIKKLEDLTLEIEIQSDTHTTLNSNDSHLKYTEKDLLTQCSKDEKFKEITLEKTEDIINILSQWRESHKERRVVKK